MDYTDYLQSGWWKSRRAEAIRQVGYKCQLCGALYKLTVHHKNYDNLWRERLCDIVVLCEKCHRALHETGIDYKIIVMCVENNIRRGSRNIKDHERGKALVARLFPDRYEEAIKALSDYVGI